jgi:hypothetical protein
VLDPNRAIVWSSLSIESKKELTAYTDSNLRMKAVLQLPAVYDNGEIINAAKSEDPQEAKQNTLQKQALSGTNQEVIQGISGKEFAKVLIDAGDIDAFKKTIIDANISKEALTKIVKDKGIDGEIVEQIIAYIFEERQLSPDEKGIVEGRIKSLLGGLLENIAKPKITKEVVDYYCTQISSVMKVG